MINLLKRQHIQLIGLISAGLAILGVFTGLVIWHVEQDRARTRSEALNTVTQVRAAYATAQVSSLVSLLQAAVFGYRSETKSMTEAGRFFFDHEAKFQALAIDALDLESKHYQTTVNLKKAATAETAPTDADIEALIKRAVANDGVVIRSSKDGRFVLIAARFGDLSDPKHLVASAVFDAGEFASGFGHLDQGFGFLVNRSSTDSLFANDFESATGWTIPEFWKLVTQSTHAQGHAVLTSPQDRSYRVSFTETGVADVLAVSVEPEHAGIQITTLILQKAIWYMTALSSLLVLIWFGLHRRPNVEPPVEADVELSESVQEQQVSTDDVA